MKASTCLRALAAATLGLSATLSLSQVPDRESLDRRLQSVGTLIESSSASRQIDSSGVQAARERRDNARLIHREAGVLLRANELPQAARLLDQAAREMMDGARLARPEQVHGEKDRRDFDARMDSTRALLAAQQRITQEKQAGPEAEATTRRIEQQVAQAAELAAQGRHDQARALVDRAYLTARVSIESMRRGDTLVRSLNFSSPREEFDYEVDRNDTHRMLFQVLQADRKDAAPSPQMQAFVERAAVLRRDAEAQARSGDHGAAIRTLEESTRELVRAIRAGGLYIPG